MIVKHSGTVDEYESLNIIDLRSCSIDGSTLGLPLHELSLYTVGFCLHIAVGDERFARKKVKEQHCKYLC